MTKHEIILQLRNIVKDSQYQPKSTVTDRICDLIDLIATQEAIKTNQVLTPSMSIETLIEEISQHGAPATERMIQALRNIAQGAAESEPYDEAWIKCSIHLSYAWMSIRNRKGN